MLTKGSLLSSSLLQQLQTSSLLPFLYSTRTLLSVPRPARSAKAPCSYRQSHRSLSSIPGRRAGLYNTGRSDRNPFEDNVFLNPESARSSDSDVPFEDVEVQYEKAEYSKKSTITPSEKAIFDRIFKDIDQSTAAKAEEELAPDEQDAPNDPYEDLNSIFDRAIQDLRAREESRMDKASHNEQRLPSTYPRAVDTQLILSDSPSSSFRAFLRPLILDSGVVVGVAADMKENEAFLKKACSDHRALVASLLQRATTDVQIWSVLEKEVFSLVKQLDAQVKYEEKARKSIERKEKKQARIESKLKEDSTNKDMIAVRPEDLRDSKEITAEKSNSVALPTNVLISILQSNYADYLLSALRLLRRHHPTSFYALHLLPHMKRLGPISYVLGASTSMYNEILFLKWTQFSDLHGMADLMQEMVNQGIETNEVTMVFIRRLKAKRRYGLLGRFGPVMRMWWDMRGNAEGWKRVWGMYEQIKREEREKAERDAGSSL